MGGDYYTVDDEFNYSSEIQAHIKAETIILDIDNIDFYDTPKHVVDAIIEEVSNELGLSDEKVRKVANYWFDRPKTNRELLG